MHVSKNFFLLQILSMNSVFFPNLIKHIPTPVKHLPNNFYSRGEVLWAIPPKDWRALLAIVHLRRGILLLTKASIVRLQSPTLWIETAGGGVRDKGGDSNYQRKEEGKISHTLFFSWGGVTIKGGEVTTCWPKCTCIYWNNYIYLCMPEMFPPPPTDMAQRVSSTPLYIFLPDSLSPLDQVDQVMTWKMSISNEYMIKKAKIKNCHVLKYEKLDHCS